MKNPFSGLKGTKIEPLVPLLTFIGDIDLGKSIENEHFMNEKEKLPQKPDALTPSAKKKKKKGLHI